VIYLSFGKLVEPFVIYYYQQGLFELTAPGWQQIILAQMLRSLLFLGVCQAVITRWNRSRAELWIGLTVALYLLVGGFYMLQAYWFPIGFRMVHCLEIFADSIIYMGLLTICFLPGVESNVSQTAPLTMANGQTKRALGGGRAMDHIVYVDAKQGELEKLLSRSARMLVRGAAGRKLPYGRVQLGDRLFFVQNDGKCLAHAWAEVTMVWNSPSLKSEEARKVIEGNQEQLQLSPKQLLRWSGKRFLILIGIGPVTPLTPFTIDRSSFGNMDDWLPVGDIERVKIESIAPQRQNKGEVR